MVRLFKVFVPSSVVALLVSEVILTYACYVAATYFALYGDPQTFLFYDKGWIRIVLVVTCIVIGIYFHDLYTQFRIYSTFLLIQQLGVVLGIAFLTQALLSYLRLGDLVLPTWVMIAGSSLVLILLLVWRVSYNGLVFKVVGARRRVLFLGASPAAQEVGQY